ncbi:MAG: family 10 glycosylhydrolase [Phycisphaerales bacterium]|nr:family 10 glycosylhydrolase [Phycisphaerales bacterium]
MSIFRLSIVLLMLGFSGCVLTGQGRYDTDDSGSAERLSTEHGLWITRWDYQSPEDVRRAIANAASIGITDIYWQVRGQADAYYDSDLEPWGHELLKYNPNPPGFDPLEIAVEESRLYKIRIHAWLNVMPLWRGKTPPADRSHMYHTNPEWRLRDEQGNVQGLHDGYVVVNPVLDSVHDHIVSVVRDLVKRYKLDGIHLDYIRYLSDEIKPGKLMPGDPVSRELYARQTGRSGEVGKIDRKAYQDWIRSRITTLVKRIDQEGVAGKRGVRLSAAVWRRPDLAMDRYLQDAAEWANLGYVDTIMPMIYTEKNEQYSDDLSSWLALVDQSQVIPGIGAYKHKTGAETNFQIALGHPRRFAIFAYATLFESPNPDEKKDPASKQARREKREALANLIKRVGNAG